MLVTLIAAPQEFTIPGHRGLCWDFSSCLTNVRLVSQNLGKAPALHLKCCCPWRALQVSRLLRNKIMQQSDRQGGISMSCGCGGKQSHLEFALGSKVKICILKQGVRKSLETVWLVFPMGKTIHLRAYSRVRYWVLAVERQKSALLLLQLPVLWWHSLSFLHLNNKGTANHCFLYIFISRITCTLQVFSRLLSVYFKTL